MQWTRQARPRVLRTTSFGSRASGTPLEMPPMLTQPVSIQMAAHNQFERPLQRWSRLRSLYAGAIPIDYRAHLT
jgi:hypothetical protein